MTHTCCTCYTHPAWTCCSAGHGEPEDDGAYVGKHRRRDEANVTTPSLLPYIGKHRKAADGQS